MWGLMPGALELQSDLDSRIEGMISDYMRAQARRGRSEPDLAPLNEMLSVFDDVEGSWGDVLEKKFQVRVCRVKQVLQGFQDNLFMTTNPGPTYVVEIPDESKNEDHYIIDTCYDGIRMNLPAASLVDSFSYQDILEETGAGPGA